MRRHAIKRGHYVTYRPAEDNPLERDVRAVVRHVYDNGTVTIETIHELDEDGQAAGRFLGDVITLDAAELGR
jgi:hypothetical protein